VTVGVLSVMGPFFRWHGSRTPFSPFFFSPQFAERQSDLAPLPSPRQPFKDVRDLAPYFLVEAFLPSSITGTTGFPVSWQTKKVFF